jgi:hypothetical protein
VKGQTDIKFLCVEDLTTHKYTWVENKKKEISTQDKTASNSASTSTDTGTTTK